MKKIIVIGSPGAGKSTFAKKLRDLLELPLYHLDMIWHKPDKTNISREEFDLKLDEIMSCDEWIIDGNYQRTIEKRLIKCDTVFLLDFPLKVCLQGAKDRIGKKRDDMPWIEDELDKEFENWIIDFPENTLPKIYDLLNKYNDKKIVIFKTREETEVFLKGLENGDI